MVLETSLDLINKQIVAISFTRVDFIGKTRTSGHVQVLFSHDTAISPSYESIIQADPHIRGLPWTEKKMEKLNKQTVNKFQKRAPSENGT